MLLFFPPARAGDRHGPDAGRRRRRDGPGADAPPHRGRPDLIRGRGDLGSLRIASPRPASHPFVFPPTDNGSRSPMPLLSPMSISVAVSPRLASPRFHTPAPGLVAWAPCRIRKLLTPHTRLSSPPPHPSSLSLVLSSQLPRLRPAGPAAASYISPVLPVPPVPPVTVPPPAHPPGRTQQWKPVPTIALRCPSSFPISCMYAQRAQAQLVGGARGLSLTRLALTVSTR